jgi:hypothetical protein
MLHFSRFALIIGAPLILAALLACVTPAEAGIAINGVAQNGVPANTRITAGSALGDLNGVAVETVIIPEVAIR